jgi:hypothetical protein
MMDESEATGRQRDVEAAVLTILLGAYPDELTGQEVRRQLTSIEDTQERLAVIGLAVDGLIDAQLILRAGDHLRLTPQALRASELDLGL